MVVAVGAHQCLSPPSASARQRGPAAEIAREQQDVGYTRRARTVGRHVENGSLLVWVGRDCFQACCGAMISQESAEHAWPSSIPLVPVLDRQAAVIVDRAHAGARATLYGCFFDTVPSGVDGYTLECFSALLLNKFARSHFEHVGNELTHKK